VIGVGDKTEIDIGKLRAKATNSIKTPF